MHLTGRYLDRYAAWGLSASEFNVEVLKRAHEPSTVQTVKGLGMRLHHEVGDIVFPGNGLCANKALPNHVAEPCKESLHVFCSGVVLQIIGGLLGSRRVNEQCGRSISVLLTPGEGYGCKKFPGSNSSLSHFSKCTELPLKSR